MKISKCKEVLSAQGLRVAKLDKTALALTVDEFSFKELVIHAQRGDPLAFFEWQEEYSVGINEIDDQHKKLLVMISEFYEAIKFDREEAFACLLDSLIEYALTHFKNEERYMKMFGYSSLAEHKKEHEEFTQRVLSVKEKIEQGQSVVTLDTTRMIRKWVTEHMLGTDQKYKDCFQKNGLC